HRTSSQQELLETYQLQDLEWRGRHEVKFGAHFFRRAYTGTSQSHPVLLQRPDGTVAERIDFAGLGLLSIEDSEGAAFPQDHCVFNDRLALDIGLRFSGQTVGRSEEHTSELQ